MEVHSDTSRQKKANLSRCHQSPTAHLPAEVPWGRRGLHKCQGRTLCADPASSPVAQVQWHQGPALPAGNPLNAVRDEINICTSSPLPGTQRALSFREIRRRVRYKNHTFPLGQGPAFLTTVLPHWQETAYHGEILTCGQFLAHPGLIRTFGGGGGRVHGEGPRPQLCFLCVILSQRGSEASRNCGQEARGPACLQPHTTLQALQPIRVGCMVRIHRPRGALRNGGELNHHPAASGGK